MVKHGEVDFVERLRRRRGVVGIGDDCFIYRTPGRDDLLFTTDLLIEDVHFRRSTHRAFDVGWKTLARGLSDIASMGGAPRFCLLSLAVAPGISARWIDSLYDGLLEHRVPLAGGDVARAEKVMCDIVVAGAVPRGKALRRDGARPGDTIYVSGALGGSALGLATCRGVAWKRHLHPEPRLALGRILRERLHATACMDISDGLSLDLRRLCLASSLAADITVPPVFPGATLEQALHGGEDYELLFTLRPRTKVPRGLFRIGTMRKGRAGEILLDGRPLPPLGYDHLR